MNTKGKLLFLLFLGSLFSVTFMVTQSKWMANADTTVAPLPSMNLTVIGNGTTIVLNETDIGAMQTYSGYGGFLNSIGNFGGWGNYTGVPLTTLCSLVETLTNTSTVKILAADNYTQTFTYSQVYGNFTTYDNTTGQPTPHNQPLTPVLAYYVNGQNLTPGDGPLRLVIVGPERLATYSAYWVKEVIQIQVIDQAVPEFSQLTLLPMLLTATVAALVCVKARRRRKPRAGDDKRISSVK